MFASSELSGECQHNDIARELDYTEWEWDDLTVMSQTICKMLPPPTANPATMATTGLGSRRICTCKKGLDNQSNHSPTYTSIHTPHWRSAEVIFVSLFTEARCRYGQHRGALCRKHLSVCIIFKNPVSVHHFKWDQHLNLLILWIRSTGLREYKKLTWRSRTFNLGIESDPTYPPTPLTDWSPPLQKASLPAPTDKCIKAYIRSHPAWAKSFSIVAAVYSKVQSQGRWSPYFCNIGF